MHGPAEGGLMLKVLDAVVAVCVVLIGWALLGNSFSDASADARFICAGLLLIAGAIMVKRGGTG